ncbi:uncharacterized protein LOC108481210 [Gossypium arboreum]|uniref:uncharacterized protein LOC108481210 n=1 Tax=Gossypium arboreum TaxID=29729 RepID=UPI0008190C88|nr:uncharacterized protein LOC108481210 [Gossypium arboreum]
MYFYKKKEERLRDEQFMKALQSALDDCDFLEVGYEGQWFTWERERLSHNNTRERLDRRVSTPGWKDLFSNYSLKYCGHSVSDHCPLLLSICGWMGRQEHKYCNFKFEATWILEELCKDEVHRLWVNTEGSICDRLQSVGKGLMRWAREIWKSLRMNTEWLKL